jgi:hypothetical protein
VSKSQIDILSSLIHPRNSVRQGTQFMMIEAYYDESGIHQHASVCVVGGYYGTQAAWRRFELQWNNILREHGLLEVGFHSKEFWARTPQGKRVTPYSQWSDIDADAFLNRLIQAVMRNRIFPIGHGVLVADWKELSLDTRKWLTGAYYNSGKFVTNGCPNKCYYLPFQFCVLDSVRHSGGSDKIHFFAGLDRTFSGYATEIYKKLLSNRQLKPHIPKRLGQLSFPLSKNTPGIQAADMLVYQLYQLNKSRLIGNAAMRPILKSLIHNRHAGQSFRLFMAKEFRELLAMAQEQSSRSV